jgi:molybdopterin molybdotransferase
MISSKEATDIVMSNLTDWGMEEVDIAKCSGRVLREEIIADRDFPPFDRVTMDGIAIRFEDFESGIKEYKITDIQTAGEKKKSLTEKGEAVEIMTGAILSDGADTIIRYEDIEITSENDVKQALINLNELNQWKNVHKKGSDRKKGDLLIESGRKLSAADVAILATVGKEKVKVSRFPKVAIISTGDELVKVSETPECHQIRMSNSVMIETKLNELGIENKRFHLLDDYDELLVKINGVLNSYDVILMSGGVSKGKADYVPDVLAELGVNKLFHKVAQRPGKPFWFGEKGSNKFVFALPGNPMSTFMCFIIYFLPWLQKCLNSKGDKDIYAVLGCDFIFNPNLTYFLQVNCRLNKEGSYVAMPKEGGGSGDLSNLVESNGFLELPPDKNSFKKGQPFRVSLFRNF